MQIARKQIRSLAAALLLLAALPTLAAPPATFKVTGAVAKPATWTIATLRRDFAGQIKTISYTLKGTHHTAHAIPLLAIVNWSGPRFNAHMKHHELQFVVEVNGRDGYTADFSLAELLPEVGAEKVWVALDQDGKPLAGEEGPVEIISPEDQRPARWVHGLSTINIVDMAKS
ncbi:MAG TPA: molybdopterin-dependent oxidoreductase [Capsulimonadaceae bacterium]|nr:molybdopterin-dependent oxidoreductase [Capsulimonadaceae bacterium]